MRLIPFLAAGGLALFLAGPALTGPALAQTSHMCAGVSDTGQDETMAKDFSLKMVYAEPGGAYLGDVSTQIAGPDGKVLVDARCDGPWLLAALPQGSYQVTATFEGQSKTQTVNVGGSGQTEQVIRF